METETKPQKFGNTVIYNGEMWRINSITNTNNVNIKKLDDTNLVINVSKSKLTPVPHNKGELIKYKNIYYIISNITLQCEQINYHLDFVNKTLTKNEKIISCEDKNIISIDKKAQEKIISFLKFMDRYNSTISYLNKKKSITFTKLSYKNVDKYMEYLFGRCDLRMSQLNKIENTLKKYQLQSLEIINICINPFDFITQDYQLITYDKAEKICNEYKLKIEFKIMLEKWSYDFFLREKNAIFIPKFIYTSEMKKFCEKRKQNATNFLEYIDKIIIDKTISKEKDPWGRDMVFKTTEYLLNYEKNLTDLVLNLYLNKTYDIDDNKIKEKINLYEETTRKYILSGEFSLEPEQKTAVYNCIKNKLSTITGYPGTGKTEILKCINFVLHELYEENQKHFNNNDCRKNDVEYNFKIDNDSGTDSGTDSETESENSNELYCYAINSGALVNPKTISLVAPTGLASLNMQRTQNKRHYNANISGTCHKTLYHTVPNIISHKENCDCIDKKNCIYKHHIGLLVIDESSMLDMFMFKSILEACELFNSRLILLGDVNQLPSIGPGQILYQLINFNKFASNGFALTELTKIKRQNAGGLVANIYKMSNQIVQKSDFVDDSMVLLSTEEFIASNTINEENLIKLINKNNFNKKNTKFITNFKSPKFLFNTKSLNNILQNLFNPLKENFEIDVIPSNYKYENSFTFRVGDPIVRTENDYSSSKMRANGEESEILSFDGTKVTIQYSGPSDQPEQIGIDELYENFALNYAITVHKSQGSQYDNVVYFIEPNCALIEKKAIYTAVSRARERCIIISNEDDFIKLQNNNKKINYKVSIFMEESDNYDL
jgi:energy-coupling factor transporter ATP-binding protein EcfA2